MYIKIIQESLKVTGVLIIEQVRVKIFTGIQLYVHMKLKNIKVITKIFKIPMLV